MTDDRPDLKPVTAPTVSSRFVPWLAVCVAVSVLGLVCLYWFQTQLPSVIRIAGGPAGGRYAQLAEGLAEELRIRLGVQVEVLPSEGSLMNIESLGSEAAHLGLYQMATRKVAEHAEHARPADASIQFVSNLYPEYVLPIGIANGLSLNQESADGKVWSCNDRMSGDFAAARWLLDHLGHAASGASVSSVRYVNLLDELQAGRVNVGVLCCGLNAPILKELLCSSSVELKTIPAVEALVRKHASLTAAEIPAGYFQTNPMTPASNYPTVVLQAQLLARKDAPVRLVEEVTRIVTDSAFQRRFELTQLYKIGTAYATERSEFAMHVGASHIFYPELKPLVNPDFVEGTEGLRSFVVSLLVSGWLIRRWWVQRRVRQQEHRLDRYIRKLMKMEIAQMDIDGERGAEDAAHLQQMLDDVTILRQEALGEFTAHDFNEDRSVDSFISMCHAFSEKINSKLTRSTIVQSQSDS